jgi:hypothetical protein
MSLCPASEKMLNCAFGSPRASSNELNDDHHVVIAIDDEDRMLNPSRASWHHTCPQDLDRRELGGRFRRPDLMAVPLDVTFG